jgi:hypothetical protein
LVEVDDLNEVIKVGFNLNDFENYCKRQPVEILIFVPDKKT